MRLIQSYELGCTMKKLLILKSLLFLIILILFTIQAKSQQKVLLFVAQEQAYYSEYIVCKAGLEAAGYQVDVASIRNENAGTYMLPANTSIDATANTLSGSSYAEFTLQFERAFGQAWNNTLNTIPSSIPVNKSIFNISNTDEYVAFVLAGGTGTIAYRVDDTYSNQGTLSSDSVELCANKLNDLGLAFLAAGKPVLAQCHGAALPVYWRIPGTNGNGDEALGFSLLKDKSAAGFPDAATTTDYGKLFVSHSANSALLISTPNVNFSAWEKAKGRLLTSRDWYPQTVAYATRGLINILETYPTAEQIQMPVNVLLLHGGPLDSNNCHYTNLKNDIPCNHAGVVPADFRNVIGLLDGFADRDNFLFQISDQNMSNTALPYDTNSSNSFYLYLKHYDVVIYYKHWATHMRPEMADGLRQYAEDGGGIVALHHGLYVRDEAGGASKRQLSDSLFGAASYNNGFGFNLTNYTLYSTNYGHFVSSYEVIYSGTGNPSWNSDPTTGMNRSFSDIPGFQIDDELYTNMSYVANFGFGYGTGQITPLFSNDQLFESFSHTSGFTRLVNANSDSLEGRLVYLQPGERQENYMINTNYGQLIRNAVFWAAQDKVKPQAPPSGLENNLPLQVKLYPNPTQGHVFLQSTNQEISAVRLIDLQGRTLKIYSVNSHHLNADITDFASGVYFLKVETKNGKSVTLKLVKE